MAGPNSPPLPSDASVEAKCCPCPFRRVLVATSRLHHFSHVTSLSSNTLPQLVLRPRVVVLAGGAERSRG